MHQPRACHVRRDEDDSYLQWGSDQRDAKLQCNRLSPPTVEQTEREKKEDQLMCIVVMQRFPLHSDYFLSSLCFARSFFVPLNAHEAPQPQPPASTTTPRQRDHETTRHDTSTRAHLLTYITQTDAMSSKQSALKGESRTHAVCELALTAPPTARRHHSADRCAARLQHDERHWRCAINASFKRSFAHLLVRSSPRRSCRVCAGFQCLAVFDTPQSVTEEAPKKKKTAGTTSAPQPLVRYLYYKSHSGPVGDDDVRPGCTLFVVNIPFHYTAEHLTQLFACFGTVEQVSFLQASLVLQLDARRIGGVELNSFYRSAHVVFEEADSVAVAIKTDLSQSPQQCPEEEEEEDNVGVKSQSTTETEGDEARRWHAMHTANASAATA